MELALCLFSGLVFLGDGLIVFVSNFVKQDDEWLQSGDD